MRQKKICVVGGGHWGKNHIRTLNEINALGGVVDQDQKLLQYYAEKYPTILVYKNLKEALKSKNFSGYSVVTPAETHYEIAKQIISYSKHVLVEKPFTLKVDHAKELVKLAYENNVSLMVGHVLLFHPAIQKIKKLIKGNKIGKLQYIYSNRLNLGKVRSHENVFWSFAPHDISVFQYFTDLYPISINAQGSSFLQQGIHDSTITQLRYPNGVEGHIFVSWLHPFKEHRLVVIGSDAMITFEDSDDAKPLKLYSKKYDLRNNGVPEKIDGPVEIIEYKKKMPLTEQLNYFVNNLDKQINISNGKHAINVTRILVNASNKLQQSING